MDRHAGRKRGNWLKICECHGLRGKSAQANPCPTPQASRLLNHGKTMTYSDPERKKIAWKKWYAKNRKHRINYIAMQRKTYPERWRNYDRRAYLRRRDQKLAFAKEYRVKNRALVIARKWGIDAGDVSKVLQASSSCDVCGSTKRLSVDHDHKTKMVRGLHQSPTS